MITAQQVDRPPGTGWNPQGALNLPDTWYFVKKHMPSDFPMPVATFVAICFEETACCNMVQQGTPAAIGPGQIQVSEQGKVNFFANNDPAKNNFLGGQWDSSMTIMAVDQNAKAFMRQKRLHSDLPELTTSQILSDNEFSIKLHIKFFQWLSRGFANGQCADLGGLLAAQTGGGGNAHARQFFKDGGSALEKLMKPDPTINLGWSDAEWKTYYVKRRHEFSAALNIGRQFRGNPVPEKNFEKFWEFFLPNEFLQNPMGYIELGF